MKHSLLARGFACAAALCLALAGCGGAATSSGDGGSAAERTQASVSYDPKEFTLGNFDVSITSATVEWDANQEQDALVFELEVTNTADEASAFGSLCNIADTSQGGEDLAWSYALAPADPDMNTLAADKSSQELEAGKTATYTYAFLLNGYDDPVVINFQSYSTSVEGGAKVSFDVKGCESQGSINAAKAAADAKAEKDSSDKNLKMGGADIELPDGWYFSEVADDKSEAVVRDTNDTYEVDFRIDSSKESAQAWAEDMASKFSSATLEERDGGYFVAIDDTSWYLFLDTSEGPLELVSYHTTYDEAADVLAGVTVK